MQKKTKDKISVAFLGNSLPMLIFAYIYKKKNNCNVTVLDESGMVGGAWRQFKYKNIYLRKQSNIILPVSKRQEKNQKKMNFFLEKYLNVKIKRTNKLVDVHYFYKNKFYYNFNYFFKIIYKLKLLKKIKVKKIKILKNNKILVNNEYTFNKIFIPTYFGINKIYDLNKIFKIDFKIIKSEHVVALVNKTKFSNLFYSDFFNNFFDRVEISKHSKFYCFSGRITKENKGSDRNLIKEQIKKITKDNTIIKFYKFTFKNYFRDKDQIKKLKKLKKIKNLEYVDTTNFMQFMEQMFLYFKYKSIKSKLILSK